MPEWVGNRADSGSLWHLYKVPIINTCHNLVLHRDTITRSCPDGWFAVNATINGNGLWYRCALGVFPMWWYLMWIPFGLLGIRFQRPWVRILHLAGEDSSSPFDSKMVWLCQSIKININKLVCGITCLFCPHYLMAACIAHRESIKMLILSRAAGLFENVPLSFQWLLIL